MCFIKKITKANHCRGIEAGILKKIKILKTSYYHYLNFEWSIKAFPKLLYIVTNDFAGLLLNFTFTMCMRKIHQGKCSITMFHFILYITINFFFQEKSHVKTPEQFPAFADSTCCKPVSVDYSS
jgi:hypothetical protein